MEPPNVPRVGAALSSTQVSTRFMQYWVEGVRWCVGLGVSLVCFSLVYKFRGFEVLVVL